jgi:hypothetical protein
LSATPALSSSTYLAGPSEGYTAHGSLRLRAHQFVILVKEQNIQRDVRVLHPECAHSQVVEQEQHAVIGRHIVAEHQSAFARCFGVSDFDAEAPTVELHSGAGRSRGACA